MSNKIDHWLSKMPVVAIIRGVRHDEVVDIASAIYESGIGIIEVPLNSPDPFTSISKLSSALGKQCVIGCGTLVKEEHVQLVAEAGAEIAVTPNTRPEIIEQCIRLGMTPMPGWATPSEAFTAYRAGARYLKLFPAASYGVQHFKAVREVLPSDSKVFAVGGIGSSATEQWLKAGISGFGIGSEIYTPGLSAEQVSSRAKNIVNTIGGLR